MKDSLNRIQNVGECQPTINDILFKIYCFALRKKLVFLLQTIDSVNQNLKLLNKFFRINNLKANS